jgi:hypothetical protein
MVFSMEFQMRKPIQSVGILAIALLGGCGLIGDGWAFLSTPPSLAKMLEYHADSVGKKGQPVNVYASVATFPGCTADTKLFAALDEAKKEVVLSASYRAPAGKICIPEWTPEKVATIFIPHQSGRYHVTVDVAYLLEPPKPDLYVDVND